MSDTQPMEHTAQLILLRSTLIVDKFYSWCASCNHGNCPPYGIQIDTKESGVCDICGTHWMYSASAYIYGSPETTRRQLQTARPNLVYIGIATANYDRMTDEDPYAVFDELFL